MTPQQRYRERNKLVRNGPVIAPEKETQVRHIQTGLIYKLVGVTKDGKYYRCHLDYIGMDRRRHVRVKIFTRNAIDIL